LFLADELTRAWEHRRGLLGSVRDTVTVTGGPAKAAPSMTHRTYDAQLHSPLDKINASNVRSLELAYVVAISGNKRKPPIAEDGLRLATHPRRASRMCGAISFISVPARQLRPALTRTIINCRCFWATMP
jgi:hypothetical protein